MQFIFASDKNNGYGLLYYDCKQMEADQVREKIIIPSGDDLDVFGFTSFGTNNNQPLFYKIKKDVNYPRGAYYIHGVFRHPDRDYYTSEAYENDLFGAYIGQDELEMLRDPSAEKKECVFTVDNKLKDICPDVDYSIFANIIEQIYQENCITVCIDDEDFSVEYGRALMGKIFSYLPSSLKKSCPFIIGTSGGTTSRNFRVSIVPKRLSQQSSGIVIDLSNRESLSEKSPIYEMVNAILNLNDEDRRSLFAAYELMFNGYNSYYQLKKFADFWAAYTGDDEILWDIADHYVERSENPSISDFPAFSQQRLRKIYAQNYSFEKEFSIGSMEELLDGDKLCEKYEMEIKRLYLFDEDCLDRLSVILASYAKKLMIDQKNWETVGNFIAEYSTFETKDTAEYCRIFSKALDVVYSSVLVKRFSAINKFIEKLQRDIDAHFRMLEYGYAKEKAAEEEKRILTSVSSECNSLKELNFAYESIVENQMHVLSRAAQERYVKNREKDQDYIKQDSIRLLNDVSRSIFQSVCPKESELIRLVDDFKFYEDIVNSVISSYVQKFSGELSFEKSALFDKLSENPERILGIAYDIAIVDPAFAFYIIEKYDKVECVIVHLYDFIDRFGSNINKADGMKGIIKSLDAVLLFRLKKADLDGGTIEQIGAWISNAEESSPRKPSGNCKALRKAIISAWQSYIGNN